MFRALNTGKFFILANVVNDGSFLTIIPGALLQRSAVSVALLVVPVKRVARCYLSHGQL
jgi:hypothetical protein